MDKPIITEKTKQHLPKKKAEKAPEVKANDPAKADEAPSAEKAPEVKANDPAKADDKKPIKSEQKQTKENGKEEEKSS